MAGMKPLKWNSADGVKPPSNQYGPPYKQDINGNYNSSDLDWAQIFTELGVQDVSDLHTKSDVDMNSFAQHHTLGTGVFQASSGAHVHDGTTSKLIGNGLNLSVTGSKGGNVALANLLAMLSQVITFTNTTT